MLLALTALGSAHAATRPHYGGTLHVEMRERVASLDPRQWPADSEASAAAERLASLIFERLVALDENGRPQPQLAAWWEHDAEMKSWKFTLRSGVKFQDGSPLTPKDAGASLALMASDSRKIITNGSSITFVSAAPAPNLPEELASGRTFIFHEQADGSLSGTGPFRIGDWPRAKTDAAGALRAVFTASEGAWSGRPFVDSIEVIMGVPASRQLVDLQLRRADVVLLAPDQVRQAAQAGLRTWSSAPVDLLALVFEHKLAAPDPRLGQALSLSIDRAAIVNVLLQKQGESAGGLLPQWLSGYAFLFPPAGDAERAKQLRGELGAAAVQQLRLQVEAGNETSKLVAERVAVNARQAGFSVQVSGRSDAAAQVPPPSSQPVLTVRLVRYRLGSVMPSAALTAMAASLGLSDDSAAALKKIGGNDPEQSYAAERLLLESGQVIPLVYLPETVGLGPAVRDWMPRRWGTWRLEDVWLDRGEAATAGVSNSSNEAAAGARP
ncbi:MAG TPA: ABC transporter substrate-binding protein [Candidatus Acidoferrales bacterium]|nr:ABC transporter substrate-binding protein [Candidatus Acidoferrales bacterium]